MPSLTYAFLIVGLRWLRLNSLGRDRRDWSDLTRLLKQNKKSGKSPANWVDCIHTRVFTNFLLWAFKQVQDPNWVRQC